jgi:hypothetical protein
MKTINRKVQKNIPTTPISNSFSHIITEIKEFFKTDTSLQTQTTVPISPIKFNRTEQEHTFEIQTQISRNQGLTYANTTPLR